MTDAAELHSRLGELEQGDSVELALHNGDRLQLKTLSSDVKGDIEIGPYELEVVWSEDGKNREPFVCAVYGHGESLERPSLYVEGEPPVHDWIELGTIQEVRG
jgi:hypothetical protein